MVDHAINFFMDCWHLKDCLKNDASCGLARDGGRRSRMAIIAADLRRSRHLANGSMHLGLVSTPGLTQKLGLAAVPSAAAPMRWLSA
jgi:hypothetical protein